MRRTVLTAVDLEQVDGRNRSATYVNNSQRAAQRRFSHAFFPAAALGDHRVDTRGSERKLQVIASLVTESFFQEIADLDS